MTTTPDPGHPIDILLVLAHPDDESFGQAGLLLLAHDLGLTTALLCATRGEVGEISDASLATRDTLAAVREQELRRAMKRARLTELRLLGYRDSGMAGTPENDDPRALVNAPFAEAVAHVVGQIRELQPNTVVSFGPDGVYGHPDHVRIGAITDAAVLAAADEGQPGLGTPWRVGASYHVASSRERIRASASNPDSPFSAMSDDELNRMGIPEEHITHWIDASSKALEKYDVLTQHRTQLPGGIAVQDIRAAMDDAMMTTETFVRQSLPWAGDPHDALSRVRDAFPANPAPLLHGAPGESRPR